MECGLCGTLNRDLARFCGGCGAPLGRVCVNCKSEIDAGLRFCDQCGAPVEDVETPVPSAPVAHGRSPEAVRKTVTVLFADLGGSTGFGERTDPEVARQVLARYHAMLQEAIDAHRGTVAKFMGDGMMAIFGIPEVAEDDAERAVRAGNEIQDRFARFADDVESTFGERLTARVGINTGEVVFGAADADLVGDALNVAARLEKACRPGHVLVGDETWRLTRGVLAYESLGEVGVAGRAQPVGTYEVVTSERAAETVAPFVGRDTELARLVTAFDHARAERAAVLVTVIGSPGLGKTRLSRELAAHVSAEGDAATFEIRCDRSGGSTFAPVADLLREAAGLEVSEADDTVTHEKLGALIRDDADRARVVDALAAVLGAAPARSVEETFWAVRRTLESLAARHPLLVVIDDIQWAEPRLLDLIDHLAEWVTGVPLLLVGLARPELRDLRPAFVESGRRVSHVVALDGLDVRATEALAAGLLGSALPHELVERLPASTDGNPLFVRELVRMLVDDGVIRRRDDGTWDLAIDADAVEVPPTIQSLLATRVERLPADELRMLELASVVGAEFSVGALQALGGEDLALPALLERLRRKELVEPTGTYWGDEPLHRFHHVLIRDAAYRRLLKGARADLHRRVGEWTDATARNVVGEHETTIAFHFEQAHRYRSELGILDGETDRLGRRAAELLDLAARRAFDRDDLASAGVLASRALAVLPAADVETRAELLLMACECLLASGDVAAGAPLVDDLGAVGAEDPKLAAWASCFHAQLVALTDPARLVEAEEIATDAAETLQGLGDGAGEAKAHQVRALLLARLGRVGEAEAVLDLALGAARAADDRRRVTAVLGAAPQAALFGPSPVARAGGRCLDVVRLLRITTASPSVEATSMRCQAVLEALRGRFDVSRSMLASSRASLEELGLRHGLLETDLYAGIVELIAEDPAAAVAPLRAAYQGLGTLGVGADAGQAAALLATALLAQGETDEAELMAAESEALAGQNLKTAIAWRIAKASVLAARDAVAEGVALAEEAVEIASATDLVLDHADACVVLADLRDTAGDAVGARAARDDARRLYEAKGATVPSDRLSATTVPSVDPVPAAVPPREPSPASVAAGTRTARVENAMTRVHAEVCAAINRRDYDTQRRVTARDFVQEDRRPLVGLDDQGRRGMTQNHELMLDQGYEILPPEPIAVRGDRLALALVRARTPAGDQSDLLALNELGPDGLFARSTVFGETDLAGALEELDARYLAGEGAANAEVVGLARDAARWLPDGGSAAHPAEVSPSFRFVDHRRMGFEPGGFDQYRTVSGLGDDLSDARFVHRKVFPSGRAVLSLSEATGTAPDGELVQWIVAAVVHFDEHGLLDALEWFDEDDFDAALDRLDELGAAPPSDPRTPVADNRASRFMEQLRLAFNDPDSGALGGLLARDRVHDDRRSIVALVGVDDGERLAEFAAASEQGFTFVEPEVIAVRGDRLALTMMRARTPAGDESARLSVNELDADGRLAFSALFDADDLTSAMAELDRRYYQDEGAPFQRVLRAIGHYAAASYRADFDAVRDQLAPDFVYVDRQPLGAGEGDREFFTEFSRTRAAEGSLVNRVMYVNDHAVLSVQHARMTSDQGGVYERVVCIVFGVDADDRIDRIEVFAYEDFGAAIARFDELGASGSGRDRSPRAENLSTRVLARWSELVLAGRFHEAAALFRPDVVRADHTTLVAFPTVEGADPYTDLIRGVAAVGYRSLQIVPIAVRGDRLNLAHTTMRTEDGFETVSLYVNECDDDGLATYTAEYDEHDLATAIADLDERYIAGEGAADAEVLTRYRQFIRAYDAKDWATLRTLLTDDFVSADHRTVGFGNVGPDEFVALCRVGLEMMPDYVQLCRTIHVVGRAGLGTVDGWGTLDDGGRYEWTIHYLMQGGADGRVQRIEWFDEDDLDAATTRLQELGTAPLVGPVLENAATAATARTLELLDQARWDDVRALYSAEFVRIDRRAVIGDGVVPGVRAQLENLQAIYASNLEVDWRALAVRGDRLALTRFDWVVEGFDLPMLQLVGLDADGRCDLLAVFDVDDLDAAIDELDARYLAGEGAEHAELFELCARFVDLAHRNDREGLLEILAPDLAVVDHLPIGFGAGDLEHFLATLATQPQVASIGTSIIRAVEIHGSVVLAVSEMHQITAEGNDSTEALCTLVDVGPGSLIRRLEWFPDEQYAAAVARLHELGARAAAGTDAPNAAQRAMRRLEQYVRNATLDQALDLFAHDFERIDHRSVVSAPPARTGAEFVDAVRAYGDVGFGLIDGAMIAARGDRLLLQRVTFGADGNLSTFLSVNEVDGSGRFVYVAVFDPADVEAAIADLDARFLAGEGADSLPVLAAGVAWIEASRNRDVDALRAVVAPDLVCVDHQPLGFGSLDRDGIIAATQLRFDVSSDDVVIVRSVQCDGPVLMARHYAETTTAEGSRYEREAIYVLRVDAHGRIDRWDVYGDGQSDAALARFHELAAARGAPPIENTASQIVALICEVASRGGLSEVSGWQGVADDVVRVDRRRVVTAPPIQDRQGFAENAAAFFEVFDTVTPEVVAVRGERLALIRLHCGRAPDFVLRILCLYEFDADGQLVFEADYDDDDLPDALTELDDHFVAGEGAPHERVLRVGAEFADVNNRRDFDATQLMLAPDFVMEDRTRLGFGVGDRDYFDASNRSREEVAVDGSAVVRKVEIDGDALLAVVEGHRYTPQGNDYSWASCIVLQIDAADLVRRTVYFDDDRYDEAVARLHELAGTPSPTPVPAVENAATRADARAAKALARADRTTPGELALAEDFVLVDRRTVVALPDLTAEGLAENFAAMRSQGYTIQAPVPLAVRGERLCLSRRVATTAGGDESPLLAITELDDRGRWSKMTFFDEDALDVALDELDERYAVGEGAEHEYTIGRTSDLRRAVTAHDWDAVEALVADDFTFTDHRPIGLPAADRAGYVAVMAASAEQTPDVRLMTRMLEVDGHVTLARTRRVGATAEGFEYDWEQLAVSRWAAGLLRCVELFALEDESAARARFTELAAESPTPYVDNAQIRFLVREQWRAQYTDGDRRSIPAEDCVLVDRRASVNAGVITGGEAVAASIQSGIDVFGSLDLVPLASRGDRVVLYRWAFVQDGGFATPALTVITSAEDLRAARIESFDERDLADAVDLLETRHAEIEGDSLTWVDRALADAERTLNHRDAEAFASLLAPGFAIADHRRLGMAMDRDAYLENLRVLIEQAPDFAFFFAQPHVEGDVALTVAPLVGTTPEGNRYEWSFVQVMVGDPDSGRAVAFEFFDDEQWDEAVVRFRELVAAGSTHAAHPTPPEPDNAATRIAAEFLPALQSNDVEGIRAFIADDYRYVDHRFSGVAPDAEGFDAYLAQMRAYAAVGFREVTGGIVAVRGERLLLARTENESREGYRSVELRVAEMDTDGKFVRTDVYDESDLARALADLNARYRESGEATEAEVRTLEAIDALNRRDWEALAASLEPDAVAIDHQRFGFEPTDRDGFVGSWMGGLVAMVPDAVSVVAEVRGVGPAVLVRIVTRGDTVDGNAYEWDSLCVGRFGRAARLEFFSLDQQADALALLEDWAAADPGTGGPDNAAARTMVHWYGLGRARDPAADALTTDDIAMVDRRRGVSLPIIEGRVAFNEAMAATDAVFAGMEVTPLAVRGERLALIGVLRSNDGFELSTLVLVEAAADGRIHRVAIFGESDLVAALAALDRRHVATAVDLLPVERNQLATYAALNRRDWPTFTAGLDDDLVIVDHRRIGFPPGRGAGALTGELQGLVAQVPDVVAYVSAIRARGRAALVTTHQTGTAAVGGHATWDFHTVVTVGEDGRVTRLEYFDHDRWDEARARFDAESAEPATMIDAAHELARTVTDAFAARDWDAIRALTGDDIHLVDRRSTVSSHDAAGADAVIALLRGFADVGFVSMDNELVATRGRGLNLLRRTFRTEAGFELQMLAVAQLGADERSAALVLFDVDDLDAATAELDRRDRAAGA